MRDVMIGVCGDVINPSLQYEYSKDGHPFKVCVDGIIGEIENNAETTITGSSRVHRSGQIRSECREAC